MRESYSDNFWWFSSDTFSKQRERLWEVENEAEEIHDGKRNQKAEKTVNVKVPSTLEQTNFKVSRVGKVGNLNYYTALCREMFNWK